MHTQSPMQFLPTGRARALLVLLSLYLACDALNILATLPTIDALSRIKAGEAVSEERLMMVDLIAAGPALVGGLLFLATCVVYCCWLHRAHRNLSTLGVQHLEYSPGWAVGYHFIPFLNLVRPYQVMTEIWRASAVEPHTQDDAAWKSTPTTHLIGNWWGAWLICGLIAQISLRTAQIGELDPILLSAKMDIAASLVQMVATCLLIVIVRNITRRQETLAQHRYAASMQAHATHASAHAGAAMSPSPVGAAPIAPHQLDQAPLSIARANPYQLAANEGERF